MSHLERELDRQLVWIERQARELQLTVEQLVAEGNALMNEDEGWDQRQTDIIFQAIDELADNCARYISMANTEAIEFCKLLTEARQ